MKYQKKPVVIEAVELTEAMLPGCHPVPFIGTPDGVKWTPSSLLENGLAPFWCQSLEGPSYGRVGDFFIRGVKGEPYFCRRDIFFETYQPAPPPKAKTLRRFKFLKFGRVWVPGGTFLYFTPIEFNRVVHDADAEGKRRGYVSIRSYVGRFAFTWFEMVWFEV